MPHIPISQITEANFGLRHYQFHLRMQPGLTIVSSMDLDENRQFVQLGLSDRPFPLARVYYEGRDGFAHLSRSDGWVRVRGELFKHGLGDLTTLLRDHAPYRSYDEDDTWVLEYRLKSLPLHDQLDTFFRDVIGGVRNAHLEQVREQVSRYSRTAESVGEVRVSRESLLICSFSIEFRWEGGQCRAEGDILPMEEVLPRLPVEVRQLELTQVSPGMLLFYLSSIGGWCSKETHGPWTQRALDLIKHSEGRRPVLDRLYAELYDPVWFRDTYTETEGRANVTPTLGTHHPIIVGSILEDSEVTLKPEYDLWFMGEEHFANDTGFFYGSSDYKRAYHHFGGRETGLKHEWYFAAHGPPALTKGNRYYSARDWGYGFGRINEAFNRLTFTRAIEQYHSYTKQGKYLAYLMLGHVIHLLEDVGQPDHAKLVAHAGSSMDQVEAYKTYRYCHVLALAAALVSSKLCGPWALFCSVGVFAVTQASCWASANASVVGYEKLIGDYWDIHDLEETIKNRGIIHRDSYDKYFQDLAQFSKKTAQDLGLEHALGCKPLLLTPPIPNCNPAIDSGDARDRQPYFDLTDTVLPEIIGMSAGLLTHFYDIVNYPPFLERVAIVQFEPGCRPLRFGVLRENEPRHCKRYDAQWVPTSGGGRALTIHKQHLALDYPAYVFLLFGPSNIVPERAKRMKNVELRLKGHEPGAPNPIDTIVQLEEAEDSQFGPYYWGEFTVSNCGLDPYTLLLEVSGHDHGPHNTRRFPSGSELDKSPKTLPRVDYTKADFPWKNYSPGVDKSHKLVIPSALWRIESSPTGPFVLHTTRGTSVHETVLQVCQQSWDCNMEPFDGQPSCPTEWELEPNIRGQPSCPTEWELEPNIRSQRQVSLRRTLHIAPWHDFRFLVELIPHRCSYMATVRVTASPQSSRGQYELTVNCLYGYHRRRLTLSFDIR